MCGNVGDYVIPLQQAKKVAVAYSGGLDSALILKILPEYYGTEEVIAVTCNVGLSDEEIQMCKDKAAIAGVEWICMEATDEFANDFITKAIMANSNYEGYPVATSMTRQLIARKVAEWARDNGCDGIAEGSTGKGNDQYRMHNVFNLFAPDLKVIVPVRDFNWTRDEEKKLSAHYGMPYKAGIGDDLTMWCRSIGSGEVDNLQMRIAQEDFLWYKYPENAEDTPVTITMEWEKGLPVNVDGRTSIADIVHYLNDLAGAHGIGKIDMFEDGLIGLKSREVYEAPAAKVLLAVHKDLEQLCLTKEQVQFKPEMERLWGYMVYHGGWYHPVKADAEAFITSSQWAVNGTYKVQLYKGNIDIVGRESDTGLFAPELRSLATTNFDQRDSGSATKIHGFQYSILGHRGLQED